MNKKIILYVKKFEHHVYFVHHYKKEKKCKYTTLKLKPKTNLCLNPPHPQVMAMTTAVTGLQSAGLSPS